MPSVPSGDPTVLMLSVCALREPSMRVALRVLRLKSIVSAYTRPKQKLIITATADNQPRINLPLYRERERRRGRSLLECCLGLLRAVGEGRRRELMGARFLSRG